MKKRSASVIILTLVIIFSSVAFVGCGVGNKSPKSSGDISGSEIEVSVLSKGKAVSRFLLPKAENNPKSSRILTNM